MNKPRFEIIFAPDAAKEYEKLDNSVISIVDKAIDRLEYRADGIGTILHNTKGTKLAGCKEIKLREVGIRIIFKITDQTVNILQVVYILAIDWRSKDQVFKSANMRYKEYNKSPVNKISSGKERPKKKQPE